MADLFTHVAIAHAGGRWCDARFRAAMLVGTVLPDVLYKGCLYLFGSSTWFAEPTHAPLVLILVAYVGALLFEERLRPRMFAALWIGMWLHILLDLGKNYVGEGVILWAYPFSMHRVELGIYETGETLYFILPAMGLALLSEIAVRIRRPR